MTTRSKSAAGVTAIIVGDTHYKDDNRSITDNLEKNLFSMIEDKGPNLIVLLGDIVDKGARYDADGLARAKRMILRCAKSCLTVVLVGNHDRTSNKQYDPEVHPFIGLDNHPNILIAWRPITFEVGGLEFGAIPYVYPGRFMEACGLLKGSPDSGDWKSLIGIFAHQEFRGAQYGGGESEKGDRWSADLPLVISGHIHRHQELPGVFYTGASTQVTFGELWDTYLWGFKWDSAGNLIDTEPVPSMTAARRVIVEIRVSEAHNWTPPPEDTVLLKLRGTESEIKAFRVTARYKELSKLVTKIVPVVERSEQVETPLDAGVAIESVAGTEQFMAAVRNTVSNWTELHEKHLRSLL